MLIFYCILLVLTIFFIVMEIVSRPEGNLLFTEIDQERHKYHLCVYTVIFVLIALLLAAERYL